MYQNIKSNLVYNNDKSEFFPCDNGVRQRRKYVSLFICIIFKRFEKLYGKSK